MSDLHQYNPKLLELFKQEAETHIRFISQNLLDWEEDMSNLEKIQGLMRAAHSLKGAARIIGLTEFSQIAHTLEDCFVAVQKGNLTLKTTDFDTLLECIDFLSQIINLPNDDLLNWPGNQREKLKSIENSIINIIKNTQPPSNPENTKPNKDNTESAIFTLLKNEVIAQTNLIKSHLELLKNKTPTPSDINLLSTAVLSIKGASNVAGQKKIENIALSLEQTLNHLLNKEISFDSNLIQQILSSLQDLLNLTSNKPIELPQTPLSIPPSASPTPTPKKEISPKPNHQPPPPHKTSR